MSQNLQAEGLRQELQTILHGAAVAVLDDRAFLRVTGTDATRWLNGMVTNSVQALGPGEGCYAFLLNAQGRILGDLTVYREPAGEPAAFVVATSKQQVETIQKHLDHFIIMDDVELTPMERFGDMVLLVGRDATEVLRKMENPAPGCSSFAELPPLSLRVYPQTGTQITTPVAAMVPCFAIAPAFPVAQLLEEAKAAGASEVSLDALEALRLLEARPLYGRDITGKYLPQETNQAQALHFNKGCYLGQEIVERIRSRGQVHRILTPLVLSGALPAEFPAPIEADGKAVGEITSAAVVPLAEAPLPEGAKILALGYVRREALDTHATLSYAGGTAAPRTASKPEPALSTNT
jgi:folate-binding protein YgfZ